MDLAYDREKPVIKRTVALGTARPAAPYNITERGTAAFTADIIGSIEKLMNKIIQMVSRPCKKVSIAKFPRAFRA
jgi:alpha-D-ribose 1-methylphosphonate 5-triphosphate diphosphatase PhnM